MDYASCEAQAGISKLSAKLYGRYFWERALARARDLATSTERVDADWTSLVAQSHAEGDRKQDELNRILQTDGPIIANARRCEQVITEKLKTT
jgi:hypothetical protein